jgi:hypothetical protein
MFHFCHPFFTPLLRPLKPTELEDTLQCWREGLEAKFWLSIQIVMRECPMLKDGDFGRYHVLSEGRTPQERGFDIMTHRRKLTHIFLFDRDLALARGNAQDVQIVAPK